MRDGTDFLARYRNIPDTNSAQALPLENSEDIARKVEDAYQRGHEFNPIFTYQKAPHTTDLRARLRDDAAQAATAYSDPLLELFVEFLNKEVAWGKALTSHDPGKLAEASRAVHGNPSKVCLERAREILRSEGEIAGERAGAIEAHQAAQAIGEVLEAGHLHGWTTEVRPSMRARMSVSAARRRVFLNGTCTYTDTEVRRLAVHEIGVHVRRSVAGEQQGPSLQLLALGLGPEHMQTEEGLAVWLEDQLNLLTEADQRKYALRALVTEAALNGSLGHAYAVAREHIPPKEAFAIVMRSKRGVRNTEAPGGYAKDHCYLQGWLACTEALETHPTDTELLWAGKVSLTTREWARTQANNGNLNPAGDPREAARHLLELLRI